MTVMDPNTYQLIIAAIITLAVAPVVYYKYFGKARQKLLAQYGKTITVPGPLVAEKPQPTTNRARRSNDEVWNATTLIPGPEKTVQQIRITNATVNSIALKFAVQGILALPFIFGGSYVSVVALANLTPTGHLYLWGTLGTIAVLLGVFAVGRTVVKAVLESINEDLKKEAVNA
jgi:hypothetical protein